MPLSLYLALLLTGAVYACSAQSSLQRTYAISVAGINIGQLTTRQHTENSLTIYSISSEVSLWFFFRLRVKHQVEAAYRGNQLVYSHSQSQTNRGNFFTRVHWRDSLYQVQVDGYKIRMDTTIKYPIYFNVARLYFDEPVNVSYLLADNAGEMIRITKKGNAYTTRQRQGEQQFYFDGGVLHRAKMVNPIKNFDVVLIGNP
jgi:hypothetical protein